MTSWAHPSPYWPNFLATIESGGCVSTFLCKRERAEGEEPRSARRRQGRGRVRVERVDGEDAPC